MPGLEQRQGPRAQQKEESFRGASPWGSAAARRILLCLWRLQGLLAVLSWAACSPLLSLEGWWRGLNALMNEKHQTVADNQEVVVIINNYRQYKVVFTSKNSIIRMHSFLV